MPGKICFITASFLLFLMSGFSSIGQDLQFYPPHWWAGMKQKELQIMVRGKEAASMKNISIESRGVKLQKVHRPSNDNYLFIDLLIEPTVKDGPILIKYQDGNDNRQIKYRLKPRRKGNGTAYAQGVDARDLIYLIMPDRFSNGDPSNDRIPGMRDQSLRRDTVYNRHGGDLAGIKNRLDYLSDLGITAIWLNPVLENDMPDRTEHGYAITNHYKVDPRLGGDEAYKGLIAAAHAKGIKVVKDAIYNHVGLYHFTVQDPPMKDWLHQWDNYTNTNYKDQVLFDPYASKKEQRIMADGWFTPQMPDLNHSNPFVEKFLIQHAIWCVEEYGIDGWRVDTYPYNDLEFMNRCNSALTDEFPKLSIFGETWVHGVPNQSYFCRNNFDIPFKSNLEGVTDFQCLWGITDALTKEFGWTEGVNKLYTNLSQDFVYKDPMKNVIFLDNHDKDRFFSVVDENMDKYKSALSWLFTARGIPQVYYGDEIATSGKTSPNDGYVRLDFPGGWPEDKVNKFSESGRDSRDREIFNHFRALAQFRKASSAIGNGKFMQFLPDDGLYVYFRYDKDQTVMVAMNTSTKEKKVDFRKYEERTSGFNAYRNVMNGEISNTELFTLAPYTTAVIELIKK